MLLQFVLHDVIAKVRSALQRGPEMVLQGQPYGAWEELTGMLVTDVRRHH